MPDMGGIDVANGVVGAVVKPRQTSQSAACARSTTPKTRFAVMAAVHRVLGSHITANGLG
jgi:hypothetical protein